MDVLSLTEEQFYNRLCSHISKIYNQNESQVIAKKILEAFTELQPINAEQYSNRRSLHWDEQDIYLITYGNSICSERLKPLQVLYKFLMRYMKGVINTVHILPFFPYSSDDGFAVIDYKKINADLGNWDDVNGIAYQF